ncbi:hypothetical protein B5G09_07955 [Alistipes sp. An54]|uniref:lipid-binding protein n=1 Tax=Alistipes sp. An54 TaxID=1965645 RepID=UPI000B399C46|nr:lipid-binding protein [Alistipes sp. An54]OUN76894.1 hypothetical protein B5G09_07955 [Alistipes sp. An54]
MKKILKMLAIGALAAGFVSCETYEVEEPEMTAVADFDGQWICFAYEASDLQTPVTVFDILVTNTTYNESNAMWMTISDCDYRITGDPRYLDALQFKLTCNPADLSFSGSAVEASQPRTCHNIYVAQGYYTAGYMGFVDVDGYTVTVTGGKVVKDGVDTKTGYKADAIEFNYSRTNPDGLTEQYVVKGMKNTGWNEDMQDYSDFIDNNFSSDSE